MPVLELILKSPTDRIAPFPVKCVTIWTVKELKLNITNVYPGKPTVESQKIIYAGKLLKDDQILKDLFEYDSSNIVHFICQSSVNAASKDVKTDNSKMEITPEKYPELYKEYQMYINNFYSSASQSFAAMSQYQQMMWINQVYMHSYAAYCAQFNVKSDTSATIGSGNSDVVQQSINTDMPAQNQENAPNNERRLDGAPENGMQNMMAAAFGGLMGDGAEEENEGEAEPRDMLHYFYMLVRFGLLLLICYYYSSVASVVTTLMLFFVFFGVNILRRNNGRQPPAPVVVRETETPQPPVEEPIEEITPENVTEPQPEVTLPQVDIPTVTERLRRAASTSFQFVFTFFVTLFPEPIAHVDIN